MDKVADIIKNIENGEDKYFGKSHFHASNMADFTLMSSTIEDMVAVYDINEMEAVEIIEALMYQEAIK